MRSIIYVGPGDVSAVDFQNAIDQAIQDGAAIHLVEGTRITGIGPFFVSDASFSITDKSKAAYARKQQPFWTKDWRSRK